MASGIGNIRRWVQDYNLLIFIPDYTLRELDFMKKGISLLATNARESIRLIDKMTSQEDNGFFDGTNGFNGTGNGSHKIHFKSTLVIQSPEEVGPRYEKCRKYKIRSPLVREFPNFKTQLDSTSVAGLKKPSSQPQEQVNINSRAEIPSRLRYLVRTCIQKQFVDNEEQVEWKVVTEDPIIKIWLESFQIKTINLRELENLLTHNVTDLSVNYEDLVDNPSPDPISNPDTLLQYRDEQDGGKGSSRRRKGRNQKQASAVPPLRKEKFESMAYASRGSGELWKP